jgi:hypothetical protein
MGSGIFPELDQAAVYLSRSDPEQLLGTYSKHGFELEGEYWPSVEHYYQAMKFENIDQQRKIREADHPKKARRLGRRRFTKMRRDWSKVKQIVMTRGIYTKCRSHPEVAEALLETDNNKLVENSQYDYFWGCGRDRRGNNVYGKVLMNVRSQLREEAQWVNGSGDTE